MTRTWVASRSMCPSPERHCPWALEIIRPSKNFGVTSDSRNWEHAHSVTKGRPSTDVPNTFRSAALRTSAPRSPRGGPRGVRAAQKAITNAAAALPGWVDRNRQATRFIPTSLSLCPAVAKTGIFNRHFWGVYAWHSHADLSLVPYKYDRLTGLTSSIFLQEAQVSNPRDLREPRQQALCRDDRRDELPGCVAGRR